MSKNRRLRVIIHKFQGQLLWRFVSYWVIYQFTMWNFLFCWQLFTEGQGNPLEQYARFFSEHYPMLYCFAILVPFFAWDAARYSHKVAGPIYRIQQTVRAVTLGTPIRRVQLREGDYLNEVADDMNVMLDTLEERGAVTIDRSSSSTPGDVFEILDRDEPGASHEDAREPASSRN